MKVVKVITHSPFNGAVKVENDLKDKTFKNINELKDYLDNYYQHTSSNMSMDELYDNIIVLNFYNPYGCFKRIFVFICE